MVTEDPHPYFVSLLRQVTTVGHGQVRPSCVRIPHRQSAVPYPNWSEQPTHLQTWLKHHVWEVPPPVMPPFSSKLVSPGRGADSLTPSPGSTQWRPVKVSTLAMPSTQDLHGKKSPQWTSFPRALVPKASIQETSPQSMTPPVKSQSTTS